MKCSVEYPYANACGGDGIGDTCIKAMEVITDFKADLGSADTYKKAIFRWWTYVSSTSEPWRASCMRTLFGKAAYCKTVNLAAKFDPHRNCPEPGRMNSTCWVNRNWERDFSILPDEKIDWTQHCPVDPVERMEFEDEQ
jgi:hypothetical protein